MAGLVPANIAQGLSDLLTRPGHRANMFSLLRTTAFTWTANRNRGYNGSQVIKNRGRDSIDPFFQFATGDSIAKSVYAPQFFIQQLRVGNGAFCIACELCMTQNFA